MSKTRYVNIHIDSEPNNIGVLSLDMSQIDTNQSFKKLKSHVILLIEEKLVKALSEHFDCEVKIRKTYVKSVLSPLEFKVDTIICSIDEDYEQVVTLKETCILTTGIFVHTKWNWEGIITSINSESFKFGQGIQIIRIGDNAKFDISPDDILYFT